MEAVSNSWYAAMPLGVHRSSSDLSQIPVTRQLQCPAPRTSYIRPNGSDYMPLWGHTPQKKFFVVVKFILPLESPGNLRVAVAGGTRNFRCADAARLPSERTKTARAQIPSRVRLMEYHVPIRSVAFCHWVGNDRPSCKKRSRAPSTGARSA